MKLGSKIKLPSKKWRVRRSWKSIEEVEECNLLTFYEQGIFRLPNWWPNY